MTLHMNLSIDQEFRSGLRKVRFVVLGIIECADEAKDYLVADNEGRIFLHKAGYVEPKPYVDCVFGFVDKSSEVNYSIGDKFYCEFFNTNFVYEEKRISDDWKISHILESDDLLVDSTVLEISDSVFLGVCFSSSDEKLPIFRLLDTFKRSRDDGLTLEPGDYIKDTTLNYYYLVLGYDKSVDKFKLFSFFEKKVVTMTSDYVYESHLHVYGDKKRYLFDLVCKSIHLALYDNSKVKYMKQSKSIKMLEKLEGFLKLLGSGSLHYLDNRLALADLNVEMQRAHIPEKVQKKIADYLEANSVETNDLGFLEVQVRGILQDSGLVDVKYKLKGTGDIECFAYDSILHEQGDFCKVLVEEPV
jgi:hypothetical protein